MGWNNSESDEQRMTKKEEKGILSRWKTFVMGALGYVIALPFVAVLTLTVVSQSSTAPDYLAPFVTVVTLVTAHGIFVLWSRPYVPWFYRGHVYAGKIAVKASPVVCAFLAGFLVNSLEFVTKKFQEIIDWLS